MKLIYADKTHILEIMNIINGAKRHLNEQGIDQWQNSYPNIERITLDISQKKGCILIDDDQILAYFITEFNGDSDYENIIGSWDTDKNSVVLHRVAMSTKYRGKGLSKYIFDEVTKLCIEKNIHGIRIDTHEDNKKMIHVLEKNGFTYCGIVYYTDGKKRLAFNKKLI